MSASLLGIGESSTYMYARKRQLGDTADGLVLKRQLSMFWVSGDGWQAVLCGLFLRTTAGGCWAVAPGGSKVGGAAFALDAALVPQPAGACARVLSCKYSLGKATPEGTLSFAQLTGGRNLALDGLASLCQAGPFWKHLSDLMWL